MTEPTKKKQKKAIQNNTPQTNQKVTIKNNISKKTKKTVWVKSNVKPEAKPGLKRDGGIEEKSAPSKTIEKKDDKKNDKKKLEPTEPVDARVIDISFEEPIPVTESKKVKEDKERDERINYLTGKGTQHPVHELIYQLRTLMLNSGFNELENSFFVSEADINKQYNINPNLVFDKVYYLAESQRPNIELGSDKTQQMKNLIPSIDIEKINKLLIDYKDNRIENYQVFQRLMTELNLNSNQIATVLQLFPEFNECNPRLTNITLRSSMASSWFTTLAAIMDKESLPIKVFSTGSWFKRGKKLDELKLSSHYGASCIIMDKNISVNNGKVIAGEILNKLGFKDLEFKKNDINRNFNVTVDEIGVYLNGVEIATCGMFADEVLNNYGIDVSTLYINFGLEHMVMVKKGIDDIRELMFPQFYKAWKFTDTEMGEAIQFIRKPKTELGKTIEKKLIEVCEKNGSTPSPCEFIIWEGNVKTKQPNKEKSIEMHDVIEKHLIVKVVKKDKDSKLCGPAYLNEIVIKNGDIFGMPISDQNNELDEAHHTKLRYLDAFSKYIGSTIERRIINGKMKDSVELKVGIIKDMEDINLQLDGGALRYIISNNKKIDVKGPMFVNIECSFANLGSKK